MALFFLRDKPRKILVSSTRYGRQFTVRSPSSLSQCSLHRAFTDDRDHSRHKINILRRRPGSENANNTICLGYSRQRRILSSLAGKRSLENAEDNIADDHSEMFDHDTVLPLQPWKILLEPPARASWRATDPRRDPPEYLKKAMYRILDDGSRTSKQLKRAHRKVLSIQSDLADHREKERRTMVNGKRHFKEQHQKQQSLHRDGFGTNDMEEEDHYQSISNSRSHPSSQLAIQPVYYGYDETLATLKHRLEPNYAITKRVLSECQSLLGGKLVKTSIDHDTADGDSVSHYVKNWQPKRVIDFGIGCGSASAAAIDLFGSSDNNSDGFLGIEWIHGIDPSQPMRECSKKLIEEMTRGHNSDNDASPPATPRITFSNSLTPSSEDSSQGGGSFDLALFVYTASDLVDVTSCLAAAAMAFEKLKPNGVFVMIEPGTPDGFNSIRAVRNMLLDCCPPHDPDFEWEDRCHIIAPCTHNGTCPMERHKKNFFARKKPIGKLGHDLPQEFQQEEETGDGGDHDDYDDEGDDDDDLDFEEIASLATPGMSETEAFNSSFCSFVHSVSGDSRRKGEKFSYLVAQKQRFRNPVVDASGDFVDPSTAGDPFRHDHVTNLLANALDAASFEADDLASRTFESAQDLTARYVDSENDDLGLELLQGEGKRQSMGRIVRAPIKKKGHVYIDYCAAPGRIIRSRVTKAMSNRVAPGIYGAARKSRWGGLWPDAMGRLVSGSQDGPNKK